jgi:hypothetical protein
MTTHPTFSQALSGMVKSIRLRRPEDAVYWLLYLDSAKFREDKKYHYRLARRILIEAAEDGHSLAVMEKVVSNFRKNSAMSTGILHLIADVLRICKVPNWWHPSTNGHDYMYSALVGYRKWLYLGWDHKEATLKKHLETAIADQDKFMALGAVLSFDALKESVTSTKQAEYVLDLAKAANNDNAKMLAEFHLKERSALSGDNNYLCQAVWMLAGGNSPVASTIEPVLFGECVEAYDKAVERWKSPKPIPEWCCDGTHCAGNDHRFQGVWLDMYAVCKAYNQYGRVDPSDKWLNEFICLDGLDVYQV